MFTSILIICDAISNRKVQVVKILEFDKEKFTIKARGVGEPFQLGKHPQGTEVKAITYSNMQIRSAGDKNDLYVIIDI